MNLRGCWRSKRGVWFDASRLTIPRVCFLGARLERMALFSANARVVSDGMTSSKAVTHLTTKLSMKSSPGSM